MNSPSLLGTPAGTVPEHEPGYFADLGLDRIVDAVAAHDPAIVPLFRSRAPTVPVARYRQDLCRALRRDGDLVAGLRRFGAAMAEMRAARSNAERLRLRPECDAWALDGARRYLAAVAGLRETLAVVADPPAALSDLRAHLDTLIDSPEHRETAHDAADVAAQLAGVEYTVRIKKSDVRVGRYQGEPDYGAEVAAVFERFRVDGGARRAEAAPVRPGLDGVEAAILTDVTALFPDAFRALARFRERHAGDDDPVLARVDLEIRWYLGCLDFIARLEAAGVPFTVPAIADGTVLDAHGTVDLALAADLVRRGLPVVGNDLRLGADERVLVITGPNHGGKTALARAFGQIHHLAALGLPVPGTDVTIGLFDELFTQFERPESADDRRGRLEADIEGMRAILTAATGRSVVVMNETFASTSVEDGARLGAAVVGRLVATGARCAYVTFVDEIAHLGDGVVSMTADVPVEPSARTFRVRRGRPQGLAHAAALARRHGLDAEALRRRIVS
ncbi:MULTISPECIES: MutS-related protein [Tsukamurella]|uniref:DNA mismatch repair protein MutS n=2 Tax=Tsukamurella TaxID=2060 RepID=A0A5C5S2S6_9ACTN|nr:MULTISPECIES: DNA mismatch repair protein MutS [Tsukamurella]NMD57245.1 DNA mismatch repair protein MutS [Tsukamurella columbiensis]TWS29394.1 DNA mismatch repair protein MutS [Tsukamurella conjunctivitidis]